MVNMEIADAGQTPDTHGSLLQGIIANDRASDRRQGLAGLSKSRALFDFQRA
jgi:hypothetical protein